MALVDIELDLHIAVCSFLHPSDILTLRKTCKTLQFATRQRIVWMEALHRVCLENKLFLPSFPISDMSDWELEQAAIRPRRWIELSASFAAQLEGLEYLEKKVSHRIINSKWKDGIDLFLVPGGRYLVESDVAGKLGVWDLGYLSNSDCKLIASVEWSDYLDGVQSTPDGMGLVICIRCRSRAIVYEIYPQSETPQLNQIAFINIAAVGCCLSPDKLIWYDFGPNNIVLGVWDYRLDTSTSFTTQVNRERREFGSEMYATQTAIIIFHVEEILIWDIPLLSPHPPTISGDNPTSLPPRIRVKFPGNSGLHPRCDIFRWRLMSGWYMNGSQPLYFDKIYLDLQGSHLDRFKLIIKPDLSDATLHFMNTLPTDDGCVADDLEDIHYPEFSASMICEDTLVSCGHTPDHCGIYTGSMLSYPNNIMLHGDNKMLLPVKAWESTNPICPASGRFVYMCDTFEIVVLDFLPHRGLDSGLY